VSAASAEVALHGITHRIKLHTDFFDAMGFREGLPGMMQTHPLQLEDSINVLRFMVGFCPQLSLESSGERICRRGAPAWHDAPAVWSEIRTGSANRTA